MDTTRGTAAWREVGVVVLLSLSGVGLASAIAFTPWYPAPADRPPAAVEVHDPDPVRPVLGGVDVSTVVVRPR